MAFIQSIPQHLGEKKEVPFASVLQDPASCCIFSDYRPRIGFSICITSEAEAFVFPGQAACCNEKPTASAVSGAFLGRPLRDPRRLFYFEAGQQHRTHNLKQHTSDEVADQSEGWGQLEPQCETIVGLADGDFGRGRFEERRRPQDERRWSEPKQPFNARSGPGPAGGGRGDDGGTDESRTAGRWRGQADPGDDEEDSDGPFHGRARPLLLTRRLVPGRSGTGLRELAQGDEVEIEVEEFTRLGINVRVSGRFRGLIFGNDIYRKDVYIGTKTQGYIKGIRDDGKLDISLRRKMGHEVREGMDMLLARLKAAGGELPFSDRTPPEVIQDEFEISKAVFKKCIGGLLKQGVIALDDSTIRLVE